MTTKQKRTVITPEELRLAVKNACTDLAVRIGPLLPPALRFKAKPIDIYDDHLRIEVAHSFAIEVTINFQIDLFVAYEVCAAATRRSCVADLLPARVSVNWPATSRSLAQSIACLDLYDKAIKLASLMEAVWPEVLSQAIQDMPVEVAR